MISDGIRHERDCPLRAKELEGKGWNGTRNGINRMGLVFKIPLITIHEWQMETFDIVPNKHEWYLPFTLSHYHSYFINDIKLLI